MGPAQAAREMIRGGSGSATSPPSARLELVAPRGHAPLAAAWGMAQSSAQSPARQPRSWSRRLCFRRRRHSPLRQRVHGTIRRPTNRLVGRPRCPQPHGRPLSGGLSFQAG
jgi:hypothetical protein